MAVQHNHRHLTITVSRFATIVFFVVFRLIEDYSLAPRIIGRAVNVPALISVVAALIGGALLGSSTPSVAAERL